MIRLEVLAAQPPSGDYMVNPTGLTWSIRRSNGDGTAMSVSNGTETRKRALATLVGLAEADQTDAWETAGAGSFWLVKRCRRGAA